MLTLFILGVMKNIPSPFLLQEVLHERFQYFRIMEAELLLFAFALK